MNNRLIIKKIINKRRIYPLSNVYSLKMVTQIVSIWENDRGFLFAYNDHGVTRLGFFVSDWDALDLLLSKIQNGRYYLEYLTKDPIQTLKELVPVTRMKRLVNTDCRNVLNDKALICYRNDEISSFPNIQDTSEINELLWSVFRPEISHLLSENELSESISKGQVTVHKKEKIDAVLMADIMPKKFYINQIVNLGYKGNIHAMLLYRLTDYIRNGGQYLYAWVDENNIASLKFHAKYGMMHDGMWNLIWTLAR